MRKVIVVVLIFLFSILAAWEMVFGQRDAEDPAMYSLFSSIDQTYP